MSSMRSPDAGSATPFEPRANARVWMERFIVSLLAIASAVPVLVVAGIVALFVYQSALFFQEVALRQFLFDTQWTPLFANQTFGIGVLISGTVMISGIAMVVAIPLGLLSAIYLSEYAPAPLRRLLKPILESLSGVPTIVYGYFALLYATPYLQRLIPGLAIFNSLSAGLVTGLLVLPIVAAFSEDALRSVPTTQRQAAYAAGFTRQETIVYVLLPAAFPGIVASFTLAASRALGETMIAAIAGGQNPQLTLNPLVPIETLTAFIVQVSLGDVPTDSLIFRTIFAVGLVLFLITLMLNSLGYSLVRRYRHFMEGQGLPSAEAMAEPGDKPIDPPWASLARGRFMENFRGRQWLDRGFSTLGLVASLAGPMFLGLLAVVTLRSGLSHLNWQFLTSFTSRNPDQAGILAAIAGTAWLLLLTALFALPIGLAAAIYMEEYIPDGLWSRVIEVTLTNATAIPGIIYGLLGLAVFARGLSGLTGGRNVLSASLMMTLLVLPLLITATRSALRQVPTALKKGGYAMGMSRWQVTWHITLPAARPGLVTGLLLTFARVLGEASPLIAMGAVEFITFVPTPTLEGLQSPFTTLTTQIFFWLLRPQAVFQEKAAAAVLVLGTVVLVMNGVAGLLRERMQRVS